MAEKVKNERDEEEEPTVHRFKVILLGDGAVGKTSIVMRFTNDDFLPKYKQTIGVDFFMKKIVLAKRTTEVYLQVWDIGGQQLGSRMLGNYICGSDAVVYVFDITSYDSFRNVEEWYKLGREHAQTRTSSAERPLFALFANKTDLIHTRDVKRERQNKFALDNGMVCYEMSAKSGDNVNQSFVRLAAQLAGLTLTRTEVEVHGKVVTAEIVQHPLEDPSMKGLRDVDLKKKGGKQKKRRCIVQ